MTLALSNNIKININAELTDIQGLINQRASVAQSIANTLSTVACNLIYSATLTISGGSAQIDLAGGSLEDPFGNALTFAKLMALFVRNNGDNAMTIGGANNVPILNGSTDKINLAADAYQLYIDENGITVTAGTGDLIIITGTNDDTLDILLIGASS